MRRQDGEQGNAQDAEHHEYQQINSVGTLGAERLRDGHDSEKRMVCVCHAAAQDCHTEDGKVCTHQKLSCPDGDDTSELFFFGEIQQQKQQRQFVRMDHAVQKAAPDGVVRRKGKVLRFCLRNRTNAHENQCENQDSQDHSAAPCQRLDAQ